MAEKMELVVAHTNTARAASVPVPGYTVLELAPPTP